MKTTIAIEGNVGCGKTSIINRFDDVNYFKLCEPVDEWKNLNGHNILKYLYDDTARWSATFQSYAMLTMTRNHHRQLPSSSNDDEKTTTIKLMERSIFSARYCFIENFLASNIMTRVEYDVLDAWFEFLRPQISLDCLIYLRSCPETCARRIEARARQEERRIKFDYLINLHNLHEEWLYRRKQQNVIVIDAEPAIDVVYENVRDAIASFLQQQRGVDNADADYRDE